LNTSAVLDANTGAYCGYVSPNGACSPGSITPSAGGELLISGIGLSGNNTAAVSIDSSFSSMDFTFPPGSLVGGADAFLVGPNAGAVSPTWTIAAAANYAVSAIAAFKHP
jgi:hypothetical protein